MTTEMSFALQKNRDNPNLQKQIEIFLEDVMQGVEIIVEDIGETLTMEMPTALQKSDNVSKDTTGLYNQVQIFLDDVMQEVAIVMEDLSAITQNLNVKLSSTLPAVDTDDSTCTYLQTQVHSFLDDIMARVDEKMSPRCLLLTNPVHGNSNDLDSAEQPNTDFLQTSTSNVNEQQPDDSGDIKKVMNNILDNLKDLLDDKRSDPKLYSDSQDNVSCEVQKIDTTYESLSGLSGHLKSNMNKSNRDGNSHVTHDVCILQHQQTDPEFSSNDILPSRNCGFPLSNPSTGKRGSTEHDENKEKYVIKKFKLLNDNKCELLMKGHHLEQNLNPQHEYGEKDCLQLLDNNDILPKVKEELPSQNDCIENIISDVVNEKAEDKEFSEETSMLTKKQIDRGEKDSLHPSENNKVPSTEKEEPLSQNDCRQSDVVYKDIKDKKCSQKTSKSMLLKGQIVDEEINDLQLSKTDVFDHSDTQFHHFRKSTMTEEHPSDANSKSELTNTSAADVTMESTSNLKEGHLQMERTRKRVMTDALHDPTAKKAILSDPETNHMCPQPLNPSPKNYIAPSSNQSMDISGKFEEKSDKNVTSQGSDLTEHGEEKAVVTKKSIEDQTVPSLVPPCTIQHEKNESVAETSLYPLTGKFNFECNAKMV